MSKYCPLCDAYTNCTDDCKHCIEEEEKAKHPCDTEPFDCPFDARYSEDCRYYCGLGVDEDEPEQIQIEFEE